MIFQMRTLVAKEFIQLFRDRLLAPFVLLGPLAELLLIAWSTSQGIDHLPTAVLDMDLSNASRGLVTAMANAETFDPYYVDTLDQVSERIEALLQMEVPDTLVDKIAMLPKLAEMTKYPPRSASVYR